MSEQSPKTPIIGIEALLGLAALTAKLQGKSKPLSKDKDENRKAKDKDKEGEICLTEAPPRADNQREVNDLAAITEGESQTSPGADQSTARTVLDDHNSSRNSSPPGGSS